VHTLSRCAVVAGTLAAAACQPRATVVVPPAPLGSEPAPAAEIIGCIDLPRDDPRSHDLSGLAWDPLERRLFALSDFQRTLTVLVPRPGFTGVDLAPSITLDIPIENWDGEALALADDRFLVVANETVGAVFSVGRDGHGAVRVDLAVPRGIRNNAGLEGLGYIAAPDGRYLFLTNEQALQGDGAISTASHGTVVRIRRHSLDGRGDREVAYLTDPVFGGDDGDNGVSDIAVLSTDRVLVLERAFVYGLGNATRIYEVDLRGAADVAGLPDARAVAPVAKRLVLDLAVMPDAGCSLPPAPQRRRSLDNYEGLALGPTLDDGRPLIFLVNDDNHHKTQVPRLLAIAFDPGVL